jgi:hypothetical protein
MLMLKIFIYSVAFCIIFTLTSCKKCHADYRVQIMYGLLVEWKNCLSVFSGNRVK